MVFCLAKSFVPRVLIDFEIFQYQFAPNCIRRRGRDEAPPCVGGDHLCARPRYIYIFLQDRGPTEWPTIANSFSPPPSPSPEEGRVRLPPSSSSSSSFLSSPPPRFLSSRFIFRALIASSLCLPFSYWRHVILLLPLPLPPPGSAASAIDDFFKQQRILIAVLSPQILAIITGGQWGRSDTSLRPGSVRIKFSVRNSLKIIFPEI